MAYGFILWVAVIDCRIVQHVLQGLIQANRKNAAAVERPRFFTRRGAIDGRIAAELFERNVISVAIIHAVKNAGLLVIVCHVCLPRFCMMPSF